MNLVFFLFIVALFLFFTAFYLCSPERNPKYRDILKGKHAPSEEAVKHFGSVCNFIAIVIGLSLVVMLPFFRAVAVVVMAGLVVCFFYRKYFGANRVSANPYAWCDQDPRPERRVGNHSESADQQPHRPRGPGHP